MNICFRFTCWPAAAMLLALLSVPALATPPAGTQVAVIDIAKVFDNHARFKAQLQDIRTDVEQFEAYLRQQDQQLKAMAEKLQQFAPGSEMYKNTEQDLANRQAGVQVQAQLKKKDILEREAKLRYHAYNEIVDVVTRFCDRNGIQMVLRFNSEAIDETQPASIQMGLNRAIVFQRELDITQYVIAELNRGVLPSNARNTGGAQIPPRRR